MVEARIEPWTIWLLEDYVSHKTTNSLSSCILEKSDPVLIFFVKLHIDNDFQSKDEKRSSSSFLSVVLQKSFSDIILKNISFEIIDFVF